METHFNPPLSSNTLLTETEAALMLGISARSLQSWRSRGIGPSYLRVAHKIIRYRLKDIESWIKDRSVVFPDDGPGTG